MGVLRRLGGAAVASLLVGPLLAGPTSADVPETYFASASGRGLVFSVGSLAGQTNLGTSSSRVDSTATAAADGAGALGLPVLSGDNAGPVRVIGAGGRQETGEHCVTPGLPAPLDALLDIGAACSTSLAEIADGRPRVLATAQVPRLDVDARALLEPITDSADPILTELLGGTLDDINSSLPVDGARLRVGDTLGSVLAALGATSTLDVKLGGSTSEASTQAGSVGAVATSQGGTVSLLPLGTAGLHALVEIEIGPATAAVTRDRDSALSSPSFEPSTVTVRINPVTTDATGKLVQANPQEITIGPDLAAPVVGALASPCADAVNEYCVLPGTPFESRIAVASGRSVVNPDGSVGAVANPVRIVALRNIGRLVPALEGGIVLELAQAQAEVGGTRPATPRELPRTGPPAWLDGLAAGMLALAVTGRRFLIRSSQEYRTSTTLEHCPAGAWSLRRHCFRYSGPAPGGNPGRSFTR